MVLTYIYMGVSVYWPPSVLCCVLTGLWHLCQLWTDLSWPQLHSISCFILAWWYVCKLAAYYFVVGVYDLGTARVAPGLRQTKLTPEHVFLAPWSRMNVSLAAQVGFICGLNCFINSLFWIKLKIFINSFI